MKKRTVLRSLGLIVAFFTASVVPSQSNTCTWTNTSGGNWNNANNWSPNQVPSTNDTAVITVAGTYSVTLDVSPTVAGLDLGASAGATAQNLVWAGFALTVNGPIQVSSNGQFNLSSGALAGTNVLTGLLTWSGGSISGVLTLATNSVFDIVSGGGNSMNGLVLTNYGTVNWTNCTLYSRPPGNALIYNYGLWNAQSDNIFQGGTGGGLTLFDNFGTFLKSGNTGATILDGGVVFNNTGTVNGASGTLAIEGGGMSSGGNLTTSGTGILNFSSYNFTNTNTFTGTGSFVAGGATFGGTIIGTLSWDGGSVSGVLTLPTNSVLDIVSGGGNSMNGLVLTNYGTVNWTNASLYSRPPGNALIYNYGLWNAQSDNIFQGGTGGGSTLFDNFGTFLKSGNTGATMLDSRVVFNNTGTVNVQAGTLQIGGGTSSGGAFATASGAFLNFIDTVYDFANTNTFTGIGSFVAAGATFEGTIIGTLSWDGGSVSGVLTLPANGVLDIVSGGGNSMNGLVLTNYGTVNWTNCTLYSRPPGNALIYNYGLWNAQSDNAFQGGTGGGLTLFDNFGTFLKSGNSGTTMLDSGVVFNNTGTVNGDSGTLAIEGGGINSGSGTFTTTNGGLLVLDGITFANSVTISSSTVVCLGGNTSVNGVLTAPELQLVSGTLSGTNVLVGMLTWSGGSISGVLTLATNSVLDIVSGGGNSMNGLVLTNYGTVNWTNSTIFSRAPGNALIYNYGLWNAQSDNIFQGGTGGGLTLFDNFGTFLKSGNTASTVLDANIVFNNTGTVTVESGTLDVNGGGASSGGNFATASGSFLNFNVTLYDFANTNTFTGIGSFVAAGATFEGTIIGTLSWDGGSVSGVLTLPTNSVLDIVSGGGNSMNGLVLTNYGTVNWTNSTLYSRAPGNALIYNYGLWNAQSDNTFQGGTDGGSTLFDNFGTFLKSGNSGTTMLDSGVLFTNTGTVQASSGTLSFASTFVQNAGQTVLNGGNFTFSQVAQLLGGTLAGAGTISGSLSNNAAIGTGASPGLLAISGNYTEGPNAHLAIKLSGTSAGANYDQLFVGGNASLAGSLDVSYWNGFTPSASNVFTVLACSARAGQFSAVTSPGNGLDALYGANNVQVVLHHPPPTVQLTVPAQALAGHTFAVAGSGTCLEGTVTNFALLLGTNVLLSVPASSASVNCSSDFPGHLAFTAVALVNTGTQGQTNATVTITTLPLRTLDAIGFQTNLGFKLLMLGAAGTNYHVLVTTNLAVTNWTLLGTMENTNGICRFFDTAATNSPQRFYRAEQLP